MDEEEKEEIKELINLLYNNHISQYGKRKLENYIKELQKENDTLKTTINKQSKDISEQLKELDKKDKCLKACEDNLIKERQLRIKQDKVINCLIDLLQQEGYLKFDNREQAIDYIDKLIKAEEENE